MNIASHKKSLAAHQAELDEIAAELRKIESEEPKIRAQKARLVGNYQEGDDDGLRNITALNTQLDVLPRRIVTLQQRKEGAEAAVLNETVRTIKTVRALLQGRREAEINRLVAVLLPQCEGDRKMASDLAATIAYGKNNPQPAIFQKIAKGIARCTDNATPGAYTISGKVTHLLNAITRAESEVGALS